MFWFGGKKKKDNQPITAKKSKKAKLTACYETNLTCLKTIFQDDDPIQFREFKSNNNNKIRFCVIYCDGLADSAIIDEHIIKPVMLDYIPDDTKIIDSLIMQVIQTDSAKKVSSFQEIINDVTYGDTLLLVEGSHEALLLNTKSFTTRAITEPESEKILTGPREGFTETLTTNLSLIRRKLRTQQVKMKYYSAGERTHTQLCIVYMDDIVNKNILRELYRRLDAIHIDSVLDANYISELIRDNTWSPFRAVGYTERPDVVVGKLLEGRIALFVDGSPVVLTIPYLFIENFQNSEDYYLNFYYASFSRSLRVVGFFLTVLVPAFYIAVVAFHREMLPTSLIVHIATERQNVPFPAALEALFMLIIFDILRETGLRMPTNIGQALGIVGALVLGQAAVEAKLVAAPMIIIVAITGITNLLIPQMNAPVLVARFGLLAFASSLGFFGVTLGVAILLIHILNLRSFGIEQLTPGRNLQYQEVKDMLIRAPWWQMRDRPLATAKNVVRQNSKEGK
ncbi:spore germination protein [Sporomusa sphaeroides DSM 2875]|uniref:spore germination protein n=1 Tax=Sporomusa sphaeroides TaxID=47679 RepID=UPI00202F1914|nr:spore germination protein [Sporomusa sphaeroides]MCM0758133.1 spore germination protein [Sporomusa sphaeroides DSM 2875]